MSADVLTFAPRPREIEPHEAESARRWGLTAFWHLSYAISPEQSERMREFHGRLAADAASRAAHFGRIVLGGSR